MAAVVGRSNWIFYDQDEFSCTPSEIKFNHPNLTQIHIMALHEVRGLLEVQGKAEVNLLVIAKNVMN